MDACNKTACHARDKFDFFFFGSVVNQRVSGRCRPPMVVEVSKRVGRVIDMHDPTDGPSRLGHLHQP